MFFYHWGGVSFRLTVELVHPPIVMVNSCTTIVMVDWQNGMCQSHGCFLQAHVTKQMVKEADAVILYHRYPHIDMYTTGKLLLTRIHPVVPSQPISFPSLLWCLHIRPPPLGFENAQVNAAQLFCTAYFSTAANLLLPFARSRCTSRWSGAARKLPTRKSRLESMLHSSPTSANASSRWKLNRGAWAQGSPPRSPGSTSRTSATRLSSSLTALSRVRFPKRKWSPRSSRKSFGMQGNSLCRVGNHCSQRKRRCKPHTATQRLSHPKESLPLATAPMLQLLEPPVIRHGYD